jgi:hypothetical protein
MTIACPRCGKTGSLKSQLPPRTKIRSSLMSFFRTTPRPTKRNRKPRPVLDRAEDRVLMSIAPTPAGVVGGSVQAGQVGRSEGTRPYTWKRLDLPLEKRP